MNCTSRALSVILTAFISFPFASHCFSENPDPPVDIISRHCGGCHAQKPGQDQSWTRISQQRKTPEGWDMTLERMRQLGRVHINRDESQALVKVLSDSFGLTPEESLGYRYLLNRAPNFVEPFENQELVTHCARCHSAARIALQRRTLEEWQWLGHFHIGQYPSAEFSGSGREHDVFNLFTRELPEQLARDYPLDPDSWAAWLAEEKKPLAGTWRLVGNQPGMGDFRGVMVASPDGSDQFALSLDGEYQTGATLKGKGRAVVYAGFEWRGTLDLNGQSYKQVLASNGDELTGRMFMARKSETGMKLRAAHMNGTRRVLAISPDYIKTGGEATLSIIGTALAGKIKLGAGIKVKQVIERDGNRIVIRAAASTRAKEGYRTVRVGNASLEEQLTVYRNIGVVKVVPDYAIARVGDNGGALPSVNATFQALAMSAGADGKANTPDDVRIGFVPARWSVKPFDEQAVHDQDIKFAGSMGADTGVFQPGPAGPNPARVFSTNNAGNLGVIARISEGEEEHIGEGHLVVTVQRWVNPPIH